ncbi:hypothetical protein C8R47DRAFT_1062533 [Mycena vitilis]|nr:hypothetical protein C8R47DRAFT_1062533 [Mycena vitilis]
MRRFHALLAELRLPAFLGRLPGLMGVPAGGSLTADQWLVAAVVVCPLLIPQIWAEYLPVEVEEARIRRIGAIQTDIAAKRVAAAAARKLKSDAAAAKKLAVAAQVEQDRLANPRPQRKRKPTARATAMDVDPDSTALDAGAVDDEDDDYQDIPASGSRKRQRAGADSDDDEDSDEEEREARTPPNLHPDDPGNFCKLSSAVKLLLSHPITDQQIDTSEQLLRSYCLELITLSTEAMYNATADDRGTIQALARQLDKVAEDGGIEFQLSSQSSFAPLPAAVFDNVLDHLSVRFPLLTLRSAIAPAVGENSYPLYNRMQLFDHVIISQRRYYASTHRKNPYDSFVNVRVATVQGQDSWVGELLEIFVVNQPKIGIHRYGLVRWFVPTDLDVTQTVWAL